jgi:succinyl-diaminopimelate desuccinylase
MPLLDPIELTRALVSFDTINPPGDEEASARYLAKILAAAGFEVNLQRFGERRFNLVAKVAGVQGAAPLGFTGHLDTVPLGTASWTHHPHAGEVADGRLYGRGSSDMKAGIAAFLVACLPMLDALRASTGLHVILTGGEETGCDGAHALTRADPALLEPLGALIVGEPTSNRAVIGHKGALWLRGIARGVTAHGAMPHEGVNAIYKVAEALRKIQHFEVGASHAAMGAPTLNVGTVQGGLNINSVPDRAEFSIDMRTVPGIQHTCVTDRLRGHLGNIELEPVIDLPPVYSDPEDSWIARVTDLARARGASSSAPRTVQFFTDAAVLGPATGRPPTIILGPGEPEMAHKTDEYCRVDRLLEAVDLYRDVLADWIAR